MTTVYDVTDWTISGSSVTAATDIGAIINSIIADIKSQQTTQTTRPGAVIYIPPGTYSLKTRVTVDVSFLTIRGSGHGFFSRSIEYNSTGTSSWFEIEPGGSHITVDNTDGNAEAFYVNRAGDPRLSSIRFENFCLDGVSFTPNENSYTNGKIGIHIASATDSTRIQGMGLMYLEHGLVIDSADDLNITENVITECGNCIELTTSGQSSKVTNNLMGAGYNGYSIYAKSFSWLLIQGNNIYPRGASSVYLDGVVQSNVSSNLFHAYYPGMVVLENNSKENLISSNKFFREVETYSPFTSDNNGLDDLYGLVQINGDGNEVASNHFSYNVPTASVAPSGATPTMILIKSGDNNYVATNHFVANQTVHTVVLDASTTNSHILDSGTSSQLLAYSTSYGFRATP